MLWTWNMIFKKHVSIKHEISKLLLYYVHKHWAKQCCC